MNRFPKNFADMLTEEGLKILEGKPLNLPQFFIPENRKFYANRRPPFIRLPGIIKTDVAMGMYDLIDTKFQNYFELNRKTLSNIQDTVDRFNRHSQDDSYEEKTGADFSINFKVIYYINKKKKEASMRMAEKLGLFDMQKSDSYLQFVENVTGLKLKAMPETAQINKYEHGDHVGLHTDYWSNKKGEPVRFIGVHIGMTNPDVERMDFCYPENGIMSGMFSTVSMGSLGIYMLPFWHATTPLQAKPGKKKTARRYLFLSALTIEGEPEIDAKQLRYL